MSVTQSVKLRKIDKLWVGHGDVLGKTKHSSLKFETKAFSEREAFEIHTQESRF